MVQQGPLGSYQNTYNYAVTSFAGKNPLQMAANSGIAFSEDSKRFTLHSLGQALTVSYPDGAVHFAGTEIEPIWTWQFLTLNHLARANGAPLTGNAVSYRDLKDGNVFYPAFYKNNILKITNCLADKPMEQLRQVSLALGAEVNDASCLTAVFPFFPRFPVTVKIWPGDEEMPGTANILFDAAANEYLHIEDIVAAGGITADFLLAQYNTMFGS